MREALRKQERQRAFTNWLANKWGVSYDEAFNRQCQTQYQELKVLLKEYEGK